MADKGLNRKFFGLFRNTANNGVVNKDPIGYFSCRMNVARFLDIEKIPTPILVKETESKTTRDKTIIDSSPTTLDTSKDNSDGKNEPRKYVFRQYRTGKSIKLKTGKKNANNNYKTIHFLFPRWADISTIADALGSLIPAAKINEEAKETDIFPYFTLPTGGSHSILSRTEALADTNVVVALDDASIEELAAKIKEKKAEAKKAAGQRA
jgi:hypothetical protein